MDKFNKGKLLVRRKRVRSDFDAGYFYHLIKFGTFSPVIYRRPSLDALCMLPILPTCIVQLAQI
jgi:hypothetical protein